MEIKETLDQHSIWLHLIVGDTVKDGFKTYKLIDGYLECKYHNGNYSPSSASFYFGDRENYKDIEIILKA